MVNAQSTIAFATLALGTSSAMAQGGFFSSFFARTTGTEGTSVTPHAHAQQLNAAPAPAAGTGTGTSGPIPTKTVHRRAKPTHCKPGEAVSWPAPTGKTLRLKLGHHRSDSSSSLSSSSSSSTHEREREHTPEQGSHERPEGSHAKLAAAGPALAARNPSDPQPTPAPHSHTHIHEKEKSGKAAHVVTITHKGDDGKPTVYEVYPATRTRCYASKPTGLGGAGSRLHAQSSLHSEHRPLQQEKERHEQHAPLAAPQAHAAEPETVAPKLTARARYLIARYLAEDMERLD